jgi:hypothetical protein
VEDFGRIGGGVEEQDEKRPGPGPGGPGGLDGDAKDVNPGAGQQDQRLVGEEELDEEGRATEEEDEPVGGLADQAAARGLGQGDGIGKEEAEEARPGCRSIGSRSGRSRSA